VRIVGGRSSLHELESRSLSASTTAGTVSPCYDHGVSGLIPPVAKLFWELDPETIDLRAHRAYVIGRVMERGGWLAMKWLRETYSTEDLREFLGSRRGRALAPRERAYWCLVVGIEATPARGGGRPAWAGPRPAP
jgi:hypothetical protein